MKKRSIMKLVCCLAITGGLYPATVLSDCSYVGGYQCQSSYFNQTFANGWSECTPAGYYTCVDSLGQNADAGCYSDSGCNNDTDMNNCTVTTCQPGSSCNAGACTSGTSLESKLPANKEAIKKSITPKEVRQQK
jgi:hypothetical protein